MVEQLLHARIPVEVDECVGMSVAGEELLDAQRALAIFGPREDDVSESLRDQLDSPEDERAHQDLAQLLVGLDEAQKIPSVDLDDLGGRDGADRAEAPPARQHVGFARELTRAKRRDDALGARARLADIELALGDDEKRARLLAGFDEGFSGCNRSRASVPGEPRDLFRREGGENVLRTRRRGRRWTRGGRAHASVIGPGAHNVRRARLAHLRTTLGAPPPLPCCATQRDRSLESPRRGRRADPC